MNIKITINNFKSISVADLSLKSGLNILIGPNGSGKTCLLSSMEFVRDLLRLGAAQALARNGGAKRVYRRGTKEIKFSIVHGYGERSFRRIKYPCQLSWQIIISQIGPEPDKTATIIYEEVTITAKINNETKTLFQLSVDRRVISKPKIVAFMCDPNEFGRDLFSFWAGPFDRNSRAYLYKWTYDELFKDIKKRMKIFPEISIFPQVSFLDKEMTSIHSLFMYLNKYSLIPNAARESTEQMPNAQMQPTGVGVSEVINALVRKNFRRITIIGNYWDDSDFDLGGYVRHGYEFPYRYYNRAVSYREREKMLSNALENINTELAAAVKPIEKVDIQTDPTNGRRFVVFCAGKDTFNPEEVSDGTIKWLCILVSIFIPFSSVYLLEEPENFLHPWMQQRLVEMMRERAQLNDTIFLLTTHSTTLLNSARPEEILVVDATEDGTSINEIKDRDEVEVLLAKSNFRLGDYWVSGGIGGVP